MKRVDERPTVIFCSAENMHPYNCFGAGKCIHCDRKSTPRHRIKKCALCNWDTSDQRR